MNENLTIVFGVLGFTTILICPFIINKITKFKLEMEKMRLEADVRKEEIRCRNQLELDKFINSEREYEAISIKQNGSIGAENREKEANGMFEGTRSARNMDAGEVTIENSGNKERLKY